MKRIRLLMVSHLQKKHTDFCSHPKEKRNRTSHFLSTHSLILFLSLSPYFLTGCNKQDAPNPPLTASREKGKVVYQTQCIACHNTDPHKPGALGPELFGSSKDLIEARVLRAEYPPGYQPKRQTRTMAPLPHLKNEIDSLHLYLNAKD